ncbi:MAG: AraC family transcriptional regulator [Chitinophagaceae bacterium]|nr:AraC family transcriptional regulator [Chitinophagaceae bacterium]
MAKKNIRATYYSKEPLGNDNIQLVGWSGNHWDNISYFPKNYQIGYVAKGNGIFFANHEEFPITAGELFFIHPGRVHNGKPDEAVGWCVDTIAIKANFAEQLFSPPAKISFSTFVTGDKTAASLFLKTFSLLENFEQSFENESKLYLLLQDLLKAKATVEPEQNNRRNITDAVNRAIRFIESNYKQSFSLDELAAQCFLSKFHLLRLFKNQTGLTPYTYQIQLRLNEARRLIFQNNSLTEVAYELGFADQAHFTNTFKKYANGANPSDLLKTAISFNFQE